MGSLKKQFILLIGLLFVVSISSHELLHDYYEDLQYEFEEECQYCANETLDESFINNFVISAPGLGSCKIGKDVFSLHFKK